MAGELTDNLKMASVPSLTWEQASQLAIIREVVEAAC